MQTDEIRFAQEGVIVDERRLELALDLGGGARDVVIEDPHVEAEGAPRDGAPDPSEAQHTERFAVDVETPEKVPLPALPRAGTRVTIRLRHAPGRRHEEGPREIRGGIGEDVRGVGNRDATALRSRDVDVVVADGNVRDDLQTGRRQQLLIDGVGDLANQSVLTAKPAKKFFTG